MDAIEDLLQAGLREEMRVLLEELIDELTILARHPQGGDRTGGNGIWVDRMQAKDD
jgi:hypothetical protein